MSNDADTFADIVADIRTLADDIEAGRAIVGQTVWRNYADRIEAAAKREKAEIEANALAVGGVVEASRKRELSKNASKNGADFGQLGDRAKMREALEVILRMVNEELEDLKDISDEVRADFISIRGWCDHALAKPPRNCERFKTKEEAAIAFANEKKQWIPQQVYGNLLRGLIGFSSRWRRKAVRHEGADIMGLWCVHADRFFCVFNLLRQAGVQGRAEG